VEEHTRSAVLGGHEWRGHGALCAIHQLGVGARVNPNPVCVLAFTRYCHYQYCMLYGIHKWGRVGGRILRLSRAMVVQSVSNV